MGAGTVAVTGASGYVGTLVARAYAGAGWRVISLGRRPGEVADEHRSFCLGDEVGAGTVRGVDVLVHAAYDLRLTRPTDVHRVNVLGTRRLVDAATQAGVRHVVLVSSLSAYPGTRQVYGSAKLSSEADVLRAGGTAVRLGLVYGASPGGMAGALKRLSGLPVLPLVGAHSHQFTVHEDDAAKGLLALGQAAPPGGAPVGLAHPDPVPFARVVRVLASGASREPRLVPLPWRPVYGGMRLVEGMGIPLPLRADSLLGLVRPAPSVPRVDLWERLGLHVRPFPL